MDQHTILLVDDEEAILTSLSRILMDDNHIVITALSGEEGLSKLKSHKVDLVISDQRMPEMTGLEFLKRVKIEYPEMITMILTAYADIEISIEAINEVGVYSFILKPCKMADLRLTVKRALEFRQVAMERDLLLEVVAELDPEIREQIKIDFTELLKNTKGQLSS